LALNPPGDIVEITIFSGSLYAVCFFPAVVFGLYWQRGSPHTVLWSMAVGISALLVWIAAGLRQELHEVFPALLLSTLTYYLLSRAETPQEAAARP
jgi:Na+/pantothenate symporter